MEICKRCILKEKCGASSESDFCLNYEPRPLTNADRIRTKTDEELARYFCDEYGCPIGRGYPDCSETPTDPVCVGCWLDWLKQEVEE